MKETSKNSFFKSYGLQIICMILLTLTVHLTQDRIDLLLCKWIVCTIRVKNLLDSTHNKISIFKELLFLASLLFLFKPILKDFHYIWLGAEWKSLIENSILAAITATGLSILIFPQQLPIVGTFYAERSLSPFTQNGDLYSTRLLMPAIAHLLFFRGYFLYYIFSAVISFIFIATLLSWNNKNTHLPFWQIFSLCTISFVQFPGPGYPDALFFLFYLLVINDNIHQSSKLSLLMLSLIAHESSIFIGLILAWRYLNRKEQLLYLSAVFFYGIIWLLTSSLDATNIFFIHNTSGLSGLEWVISHPLLELLGIIQAYKITWLFIIWGIIIGIQNKLWDDVKFIVANICVGILLTILAIDTSRMMGFAFPGLLISILIIKNKGASYSTKLFLPSFFLSNLLVPSMYVGLNVGVVLSPGLYKSYFLLVTKWAISIGIQ